MFFKPFEIFVALRYTKARKKNYFVSFISLSSMLGIGLGVMVLITVLSVMNGFDFEIHKRFFGMAPEITVSGSEGKIVLNKDLENKLRSFPEVLALAPFVGTQGLMTYNGQVVPIVLTGIDAEQEKNISHLNSKMLAGSLNDLHNFGIILGKNLAEALGTNLGDAITVMVPAVTFTPTGMVPRFKRFHVVGIFSAGSGFNFDAKLAFINLVDAQKLQQLNNEVTGIKLKIKDIYAAPQLAMQIAQNLGIDYVVNDWTQQFGAFFQAVKMEKTMMFFILLLIIAVAAFNLVSSLVMVVNDKQAEIAILRTIGVTPGQILKIFIAQGMIIGVTGILLGTLAGIILALNASDIVDFLQNVLNIQFFSSNVYFVDYLPSKILITDLIKICLAAFVMCFLATLYPAWRASKTIIAEALHYE